MPAIQPDDDNEDEYIEELVEELRKELGLYNGDIVVIRIGDDIPLHANFLYSPFGTDICMN